MGRLIDIDRLCNDLAKRWSIADKKKEDTIRAVMADVVTPIVVSQPTVDAVPVVTGTWKAVTDDGENYKRICTCCGKEAPFDELEGVYLIYQHCPWCGADMREDGGGNGDETQSRIERVLSGKTPEEQYDILYWLMMEYGKGHSNSRLARIEWLKGEKDFCSFGERKDGEQHD